MDLDHCTRLSLEFEQKSKLESQRVTQRAIAWRQVYQLAQQTGQLECFDYEEFHREQCRIAADPPIIVRKERKAGGGTPS